MECQTLDPVEVVVSGLTHPAEAEHLGSCALCAAEVAEVQDLLQRAPLGEELAAAFGVAAPGPSRVPNTPPRRPVGPFQAGEGMPLLADDLSDGGTFARFVALEPPGLERVRLEVTLPKGQQLLPMGVPVTVRYTVDADCDVLVVHRNGTRQVQVLSPTPDHPDPFWRAGTAAFTGLIEGHHGERQQFVILATTARVLPHPIPFGAPTPLEAMYVEALARVKDLPVVQWCKAVWPYTAVDLDVVAFYRAMTDLAALRAACLREIHDKQDWVKAACGEVCRRVLALPADVPQPSGTAVRDLFVHITQKLIRYWVGHWRGTWEEQVLEEAVQAVYEQFFQTARRRALAFTCTWETVSGPPLQFPCYTALLAFLKTITLRVVFAEWRAQRRREIHAFLRAMHRGAAHLSEGEKALLRTWVCEHVQEDGIEHALVAGVFAGMKPKAMLAEYPVLQQAFGGDNKQLANTRDALLWRVYQTIRQRGPDEVRAVLTHLLAADGGQWGELEEDDPDDDAA